MHCSQLVNKIQNQFYMIYNETYLKRQFCIVLHGNIKSNFLRFVYGNLITTHLSPGPVFSQNKEIQFISMVIIGNTECVR